MIVLNLCVQPYAVGSTGLTVVCIQITLFMNELFIYNCKVTKIIWHAERFTERWIELSSDFITIWGPAWLGWDVITDWGDIYIWRAWLTQTLSGCGSTYCSVLLVAWRGDRHCTFDTLNRWEALYSLSYIFAIWGLHMEDDWYWLVAPHLHLTDRGPPVPCDSWV